MSNPKGRALPEDGIGEHIRNGEFLSTSFDRILSVDDTLRSNESCRELHIFDIRLMIFSGGRLTHEHVGSDDGEGNDDPEVNFRSSLRSITKGKDETRDCLQEERVNTS